MFKKLVSILFEEEEITIEEDLDETPVAYEIPKLKPMAEKKRVEKIKEPEVVLEAKTLVSPEVSGDRKSMMIDVDIKEVVLDPVVTPVATKVDARYQPKDIISPIFGGPESPSQPIEPKSYVEAKTRQPLTEIISPMFGKVELVEPSNGVDASLLDIDLSDMLNPIEEGEEVQASLFDYLEGFSNDEE